VLITLIALVGFDIAAVTEARRYLLDQTDSRLRTVLNLYRPVDLPRVQPPPGKPAKEPPMRVSVIAGPRLLLTPPVLGEYYVAFVPGFGDGPRGFVVGNPGLVPRLPRPAGLRALAAGRRAQTVTSLDGKAQLRMRAVGFPGAGTVVATTSLVGVNDTVGRLELIVGIGSAAAGLLVALGVAWVMRRGLHPIEAMAAQADRITAGDLTERVSPHDPATEVGRLGTALNGMLTRIESFVHEREASQEATRRFFADASHELRNPLASLRANAELYQQGALRRRAQVDEAMRRIAAEAQRMSALVDDMLGLARLDQRPEQRHDRVDLTALVTECAERARIAGPQRTWQAHVAAGLVLTGDAELLRRAIDNLLANVCAHTPDGTVAAVTAAGSGASVTVEVSDDGPGVAADQLPRLFDRFYRARTEASPHRPGSGLGLAIVAAVAAAHHGTAEAAINDPHGLRITLTLPAAAHATQAVQAVEPSQPSQAAADTHAELTHNPRRVGTSAADDGGRTAQPEQASSGINA
jgi:two-component system OmpR family sensor kinase